MINLTEEQRAAIESGGRTIVSASAGSGKTFVMIRKLVAAIESGVDLDNVLAVTFTKKAAAQMKEKLRSALIAATEGADDATRTRLKIQLSKVQSANISTIHAFCAKLLRTYFYALGIDGTFDIISSDDAAAKELKTRAIDALFERYYAEDNPHFMELLRCYRKKRSDAYLKGIVLDCYERLRINARYTDFAKRTEEVYSEEGFLKITGELKKCADSQYELLLNALSDFAANFISTKSEAYGAIFGEMAASLFAATEGGLFSPKPPLCTLRKPVDGKDEKLTGEKFKEFKDRIVKRYNAVCADISDEQTERSNFLSSGVTAKALANVLMDFDAQYTAVKREENKLDYNDLEHLTLALLDDAAIRAEIKSTYSCVFVDEYQDVNPVQEEIISLVGGENVFLVGDVKQAIYGFRGSKSLFFAEKYNRFEGGGGTALRLSGNFRSCGGVVDFVNSAFSQIMTSASCGIDYSKTGLMTSCGGYPQGYGSAKISLFGKDEEEKRELGVYSVNAGSGPVRHTREGLAVLGIVERELQSKHYDLKTGELVDTQAGDICILTRKRGNAAAQGIVRALTDAGYSVSGAQEENICNRPEVREMLDILSYLDNSLQDIPLTTALLSPLGGLDCDELASIRIAAKGDGKIPFRECCEKYAVRFENSVSKKLVKFFARAEKLRALAEVFSAAQLIDKLLEITGLEAAYSSGGGEKLKNLRRLAAEGEGLSLPAFLGKVKDGGFSISAPAAAASDSIKIMTMHASKGLEFPVVIISDICATFRGRNDTELPFDETYGFAPKCFDGERMLTSTTVLRRLSLARAAREELKNELNLFYVACTRAMCRLHILARELTPYDPLDAVDAKCYARLFDMSKYMPEELPEREDFKGAAGVRPLITAPDASLAELIDARFMRGYSHSDSVNLPVKSSASAILRLAADEPVYRPRELFGGEGETGTERGTAYHRFLELCDFSVKSVEGISAELDAFVSSGLMSAAQRELVGASDLAEILDMSVFGGLDRATTFREREFLCRLPANEFLDGVTASDEVMVQGAIDLLCVTESGIKIIDYKYSRKGDDELIATYSKQLSLYKKAVALIMRVDETTIECAIVNIFRKRQIILN